MVDDADRLLTVQDVCRQLGVSRTTLYHWMRAGVLPYVQLGGRRRFRRSDLDRWIAAQTVSAR